MKNQNSKLSQKIEVSRESAKRAAKPARNKSYLLDLRIHSPASLGYLAIEGIDTAPALVRLAQTKGLDVIAVTDFYSGKYVDRITHAARDSELTVIPGVVIRCSLARCNDVTLLILFPEGLGSQHIHEFLAKLDIPEEASGRSQYLVQKSFDTIIKVTEEYSGLILPSRMDKTPHRKEVIPTLVEQYGFRAFDLAYQDSAEYFAKRWPKIKFQLFSFSNAQALAQVGSRIAKVKMPLPGFNGISQLIARE